MNSPLDSKHGLWVVAFLMVVVFLAGAGVAWRYLAFHASMTDAQGTTENESDDTNPNDTTASIEPVKRAVVAYIASDLNMNPDDVTGFNVTAAPSGNSNDSTLHLAGNFTVDSESPSNLQEAVTQQVNNNIRMVQPNQPKKTFHHVVYFDAVVRSYEKLDQTTGLKIEYKSSIDQTLADKARAEEAAFAAAMPPPVLDEDEDIKSGVSTNGAAPSAIAQATSAEVGSVADQNSSTVGVQTSPSFDCDRASTSVELTICSSPRLRQIDAQMGTLYKDLLDQVRQKDPTQADALRSSQVRWIRDRQTRCNGNAECIEQSLRDRIAILESER